MSNKNTASENHGRAHNSTPKAPISPTVRWEGRELKMSLHQGMWRIRSRSKSFPVDISTGTASLPGAKRIAREQLADLAVKPKPKRSSTTLEDVARAYLNAPRRANERTARGNVSALRMIVRKACGKRLADVQLSKMCDLWPAYIAAMQGLPKPDYATRRESNHAICARIGKAASIFMPTLRPYFKSLGILIPSDTATVLRPATGRRTPTVAEDDTIVTEWPKLRAVDFPLWVAVGLARFAGLRQGEIAACRGKWVRQEGAATYIDLKDREEDGFFTKTGKWYSALVLSPDLTEYLTSLKPDELAVKQDTETWIKNAPQCWLRKFTGNARCPLHRLRGLYADHVKRETAEAMLARAAAIKEASRNLGHTSTAMTEGHYLTPDGVRDLG